MKRDKIISLRVDSELYNEVQKIINSRTEVYKGSHHNYYYYKDEKGLTHDKFTIADLLEEAMKQYIKKTKAEM